MLLENLQRSVNLNFLNDFHEHKKFCKFHLLKNNKEYFLFFFFSLALKTPPAFHEQRKQLERAKTGDLLKAKIQQRPGREELVRQHILEDVGHVDPSLAERQRMLKKARLADQLNDQLSHRPGPLELIQKNILHTEEPIERAVKGELASQLNSTNRAL